VDADFPAMITTLEGRMSREDIASALGVDERKLDEIASGYVPEEDVANRLRALVASGVSGRVVRISTKAILIFVIADAVFFAAVAVFLLVR
jgi:DNA-binding Lrp family transcriptional regulator